MGDEAPRKIVHETACLTIALASVGAAILLRSLLDPILGDNLALITLYGAVAIAVWFAGLGYGLLATLVGYAAASYLFIPPRGAFDLTTPAQITGLALYLISCGLILFFGERLRGSKSNAV